MPKILIGSSGFNYFGWRKRFYPEDLPQRKWLEYYSGVFKTVELNVTFYRLPKESTFKRWYKETPNDFSFAVKGSRLITHMKRLSDIEEPLRAFFNNASALGEKLEITLWQFPPGFPLDLKKLEIFIKLLSSFNVRAAFEFRHPSWINDDVRNLLEENNFSFCSADWPPFLEEVPLTADYIYIRRHGHGGNYATCYTDEEIMADAEKIKEYANRSKDVYVYFNNDAYAYSVQNAKQLIEILRSHNLI
ncbi:MAG: DUF72 domain-containing protein [Desulfobacterota bacterium]|nr:DUF72 domain-containing protein [Thermodesulfobacteriota bacterium]MDW8002234.1 DUF72 domain-containing protein [Deltaproteobacteria bacterium]